MRILWGTVCLAGGVASLLFGLAQPSHSSHTAIVFFVIAGILVLSGAILLDILDIIIDGIDDIF